MSPYYCVAISCTWRSSQPIYRQRLDIPICVYIDGEEVPNYSHILICWASCSETWGERWDIEMAHSFWPELASVLALLQRHGLALDPSGQERGQDLIRSQK
jgi:hypothetical protein